MASTRSRSARVLAAMAIVLSIVAVSGYAALQTRRAKDALADWLNGLTDANDTIRVRFGTIEGNLPFSAQVSEVVLSDRDGPWLTIRDVELDALLRSLVRGRIRLAKARATALTMARLPRTDEEDDEPEPVRHLPLLLVDRLKIDRVELGHELLGGWSPGPLTVRASGSLRLSDLELAVQASVVGTEVEPLEVGGAQLAIELLHVEGAVTGPAEAPSLRLHGETEQLLWGALSADGLSAELTAGAGKESYDLHLQAKLATPRMRASSVPTSASDTATTVERVVAALEAPVEVDVEASFDQGGDRLRVAQATATAGEARARIEDLALIAGRTLTVGALRGSLEDVSRVAALSPLLRSGSVALDGGLRADLEQGDWGGDARLDLSALEATDPRYDPLIGGSVRLTAEWQRDASGALHLEPLGLQATGVSGSGKLTIGGGDGEVAGEVDLQVADVAAFDALVGAELRGAGRLEASVSGELSNLSLDAVLSSDEIGLVDAAGLSVRARAHADGLPSDLRGTVRANVVSEAGPATLGAGVRRLADGRIRIEDLDMQGASATLRGLLTVDPSLRTVDGRVAGSVSNFATLAGLLGYAGAGSAEFEVLARSEGSRQDAAWILDAKGVALSSGPIDGPDGQDGDDGFTRIFRADTLAVRFQLDDLFGTPSGTARVEASDSVLGAAQLASLSLTGQGTAGVWDARLSARGSYVEAFDVETAATLDFDFPVLRAEVKHLRGTVAGRPLALAQPAIFVRDESDTSVSQLDLSVGSARVHGSFASRNGVPDGSLALDDVPLDLLQLYDPSLVLTGTIDGTIRADAAAAAQAIVVSLSAADVIAGANEDGDEDEDLPPFSASLDGEWRPGLVDFEASISSGQTTALRVSASVPLGTQGNGRAGDSVQIDAHGPIDLALLEGLINVGEDTFAGTLVTDVSITGSVDAPSVAGTITMRDGVYESSGAGVTVRDIALRVDGEGHRLVLRELTANDGNGGSLRGIGSVDLAGGPSRVTYEATVTLDSFWIVRVDEATAKANGDLVLTGHGDELTLAGSIKTVSAELRAPNRIPPEIVTLPVVEENAAALEWWEPGRQDTSREVPVNLDVTLKLTDRVFFRAPDLDTEWKGQLHIGGKVESPSIEGRLTLVRGSFNALGIRFNATQGKLTFDGGSEIDPSIDFVAEASRNGIVARVRVSGAASSFRLDLTSDPALPTDEIVSRLLYGESPSNLTAAQSIQLAAAVARLTQPGVATPLDWVRRTFGVDRVSIESGSSNDEGSVVSVGKYLGRGVFVSIDQGLTGESSKAKVEVEVTRQINLESELGTDSEGRLGVNWRWRY